MKKGEQEEIVRKGTKEHVKETQKLEVMWAPFVGLSENVSKRALAGILLSTPTKKDVRLRSCLMCPAFLL